jgi:hypothetical protein
MHATQINPHQRKYIVKNRFGLFRTLRDQLNCFHKFWDYISTNETWTTNMIFFLKKKSFVDQPSDQLRC